MKDAVQNKLFALAESAYRDFTLPLIPGLEAARLVGVRMPALRKLAAEIYTNGGAGVFFALLPHFYHEENCLHALLIGHIRDYGDCVARLDEFLPHVDNWALCDIIRPRCFKKHRAELIGDIRRWAASGECYTVRFGLEMLMTHFLDEDFQPEYLDIAASVQSEEYYVNMMVAWYFATALAKQWDAAIIYLREKRLSPWVHNKTIRKAIESYRVSDGHKAYLRGLTLKKSGLLGLN